MLLSLSVIVWLAVKLYKLNVRAKGQDDLFNAAISAAIVGQKVDNFIDAYSVFVGELVSGNANKIIFSLYDQHGIKRPPYAIIDEHLKNAMKSRLKSMQKDVIKHYKLALIDLDYDA